MTVTSHHTSQEIQLELYEPSDNAQAVVTARRLAAQAGFSATLQFLIATAVSELATNIIRYAGRGEITLRVIINDHRTGLEVVALDAGPGIENIEQAMQEHFSSGHSLGLGLPSVKRIMDEFTITSTPGQGTMIVARKWR
ncbi:MAG: anti-sigma regulatory factor [Deltaproteobacteria bacterium]|nr:anti-sigma regulatory factor [Deltaproteobacteria bacterium]